MTRIKIDGEEYNVVKISTSSNNYEDLEVITYIECDNDIVILPTLDMVIEMEGIDYRMDNKGDVNAFIQSCRTLNMLDSLDG